MPLPPRQLPASTLLALSGPVAAPSPAPPPAGLWAQLLAWLLPRSSPQGHYPASSPSLLFLSLALKERVVGAIAGAPSRPDWPRQALTCHVLLCWPAARQRKRGQLWGHLVPSMELGQDLLFLGLRWQGTCPGGSHLTPGLSQAGASLLPTFGANTVAKPIVLGAAHGALRCGRGAG